MCTPMRPLPRRQTVRMALAGMVALPFVIAGCSLPGAALHDGAGITGTYVVNGIDPVGVEYSGTVVITDAGVGGDRAADGDGRYHLEWIVTGTIQEGTGTLDGDRLDVDWTTRTTPRGDSAASGTASYTVAADGALHGTRAIDGVSGTGTEDIFPEP